MPKYFWRRALFWSLAIPQAVLYFCAIPIRMAIGIWNGLGEVLILANFRLECWAHGVPKGQLLNCPWKTTLGEAWREGNRR